MTSFFEIKNNEKDTRDDSEDHLQTFYFPAGVGSILGSQWTRRGQDTHNLHTNTHTHTDHVYPSLWGLYIHLIIPVNNLFSDQK